MKLWSDSFRDGEAIPPEFAFGRIDSRHRVALAPNRNPQLAWWDVPDGTRSIAVLCHDFDVPGMPDDVNHPDREVPTSLPRVDFHHWVLVDLPPSVVSIVAGEFSDGVVPRGKSGPQTRYGARQGLNDYTIWFAADHDMAGDYYGYDGPCPPWNDALIHRYQFAVYALDLDRLPVEGRFTGPQVLAAMAGHVLARATVTGSYTLNARLAGPAAAVQAAP
jgi:Raf kinase inhibitor-like YbhB/YbcL family protein